MSVGKLALKAVVAASVAVVPAVAHASAASALSLSSTSRAGAAQQNESELGGGFIIPLLALAAIVAGILVVIDNDDEPVSP
jgi:hypothetical protein